MNQTIQNSLGEKLDYSFAHGNTSNYKNDWIVVLGHGVTGNKDRPVIVDTAQALNEAGFDTLRFSFAGNGDSEGDFKDATISKEVGDLEAILNAVSSKYPKIAYVGHSMGNPVGILQAIKDRRIQAIVSLAGMIDTKTFAQTEFGDETPDEVLMWEEASCPLSSAYMHDLCDTIGTVQPLIDSVQIPWLLLHGTADDVVLPKDTETVASTKGESVTTIYIDGADHSFNDPSHKAEMTQAVVNWLSAHVRG